ncbi:MAG: hypothetical protein ABSA71_12230 [Desulfomonilia bacterium]|jgi:hypothetical protein
MKISYMVNGWGKATMESVPAVLRDERRQGQPQPGRDERGVYV